MRPHLRSMMIAMFTLSALVVALAQDSAATLSVRGDIQKPAQWSVETLKVQFSDQIQDVKFTAGMDKSVKVGTGIPLLSLIQAAGLKTDQHINHHDLKFLVILEAKDSYEAFFSLAELMPTQGRSPRAFLVWDVDGRPLPEKEAPLRLVLTVDGEARQIHGVATITLVDGVKLANQLKGKEKQ